MSQADSAVGGGVAPLSNDVFDVFVDDFVLVAKDGVWRALALKNKFFGLFSLDDFDEAEATAALALENVGFFELPPIISVGSFKVLI